MPLINLSVEQGLTLPEETVPELLYTNKTSSIKANIASMADNTLLDERYKELTKEKQRLIQAGRELEVQRAAAAKGKEIKHNEIASAVETALQGGADAVDVLSAYKDTNQRLQEVREEMLAADNLRKFAESDPEFFAVLDKNRDFMDTQVDALAKDMIIQNRAAEWEAKRDSFWGNVADLPETLIGSDIDQALRLDREQLFKDVQNAKQNLNAEDFGKYLDQRLEDIDERLFFDNDDVIADVVRTLTKDDIKAAVQADNVNSIFAFLSLFDIAAISAGIKTAGKSVLQKGVTAETVVNAGGSHAVADDIVRSIVEDSAENARFLGSDNEAVAYALQGKLPTEIMDTVPAQTRKKLEANERILAELNELPVNTALSAEDLKRAALEAEKRFSANFHKGALANTRWVHDAKGNLTAVEAYIVNEKGVPFATEALAKDYAEKKGLKDVAEFSVIRDESTGGYALSGRATLDPTNISPALQDYRNVGYFKAILFQPDEFIAKNLMAISRGAELSVSRLSENFRSVWNDTLGKINADSRKKLGALMDEEKLKDAPQWLTPGEFKQRWSGKYGKAPTDKEIQAYLGARQLEDSAYRLVNSAVYNKKLRQGFKTLDVGDGSVLPSSFNAAPVRVADIDDMEFLYDLSTNQMKRVGAATSRGISKDDLTKLQDDFDFYRVDGDEGLAVDGVQFTTLVLPKGKGVLRDLGTQQVGYVAGGRIFYDYGFFVKAARKKGISESLGGGTMVKSPVALFGAKTRKEAKEFATKLESIRQIAVQVNKGQISKAAGNDQIAAVNLPRFQDYDSVTDFLSSRGVKLEDEIGFAADREAPVLNSQAGEFLGNPKADAEFESFRTRWNSSRSAHRVEDVRGEAALKDPFESLSSSLNGAARMAAFSDFKEEAVSMFARTFGKHMNTKPGAGINNMDVLLSGVSKEAQRTLSRSELATIWAHKQQILHTIRHRTPTEEAWANVADGIADWAFEKGAKGLADKVAASRMSSPIGKIKSYSFNMRLGMYNPAQLLLQSSAAANIIALSPKYGLQSAMDVFPARIALMARDPAVTKELAEKLGKGKMWNKKEAGEFAEYVEEFRNLGFNDFGRNISEIDAAAGKHFSSGAFGKFVEHGKVFFAEGERVPRLTAYGVARRKWLQNADGINPNGLKATSAEGREFILQETNRLTLGMTGADIQIGLRGAAGIPTQFWSYPFRMVSTLFGGRLTGREKAQLIVMYAATAGAAGIPLGDQLLDLMQKQGVTDLSGEDAKLAYNGLIDLAVSKMSDGELETDWSSKIGAGTIFESVYKSFAEDPVLTMMGGPTGQSLGRGYESLIDSLTPIVASRQSSLEQISEAAIQTLSTQITSVDKSYKMWLALETGKLIDSKGRTFKGSVTKAEIISDLLAGVPLDERAKTFDRLNDIKKIKDLANTHAEQIIRLQEQWYRADSDEEQDMIKSQIHAMHYKAKNNGIAQDVNRIISQRYSSPGFSEEIYRAYMRKKYFGAKTNPALIKEEK